MTLRADLSGRVALVTGASGGLGSHFARTLAANGAAVALAARRADRLHALAEEIRAPGGRVHPVPMDVTDPASVIEGFEEAQRVLGRVDVVVNNSGIASDTKPLLQVSDEEFGHVLDVNLLGAKRVAVEAARRLIDARHGGSIINIASLLGLRVAGGVGPYAASKAALVQLTRVMALELARHNIRVNAIAPGYVATDLNREFLASESGQALMKRIPQRRFGEPRDLDGVLLLLASESSSFMTGETIVVDGGHLNSTL